MATLVMLLLGVFLLAVPVGAMAIEITSGAAGIVYGGGFDKVATLIGEGVKVIAGDAGGFTEATQDSGRWRYFSQSPLEK